MAAIFRSLPDYSDYLYAALRYPASGRKCFNGSFAPSSSHPPFRRFRSPPRQRPDDVIIFPISRAPSLPRRFPAGAGKKKIEGKNPGKRSLARDRSRQRSKNATATFSWRLFCGSLRRVGFGDTEHWHRWHESFVYRRIFDFARAESVRGTRRDVCVCVCAFVRETRIIQSKSISLHYVRNTE